MSEADFSRAAAVERRDGDRFVLRSPASWAQGKGTFGGVVIGGLVNVALALEPDATRQVRVVAAEILGPVPAGEVALEARTLRRGSGLSAYAVEARGDDVLASATVTLARARGQERFAALTPPTIPPFDSVPRAKVGPPFGPVFTQHVDFRPTGPAPFSGASEARVEGWARLTASSWGPAEIIALADSYWPSVLARESEPRPVVTVSFVLHLVHLPPPGPLYLRGRAVAGAEGHVSEERELWTERGELVALNHQLFVVV